MADDLGFSDIGCYGATVIETPNLDRLAGEGLRFRQFYNTAKCHSSRVSLLTGLYCNQAGSASLERGTTIAEVLGGAGYHTLMSGKWHLDDQPTDHGFQKYWGHLSGATNYFTGDDTFRLNGNKWDAFDGDFYTTDAMTDYAIQFVDEAMAEDAQKPFFLYVAYNAPHYPLQAPEEDVMKYRGKFRDGWDELRQARYEKQLAGGLVDASAKLSPRPGWVDGWDALTDEERDWEDFRMATFAAMVDRMDQNIGRLTGHLQELGKLDNTLFLFCADNGGCPFDDAEDRDLMPWTAESYWSYGPEWANASNTPFRWYKQNSHEGGISSPLVVHWPAGLKTAAGSLTDQPGHLIDFMATAIELAGTEYPERDGLEPLQGRSLAPIFRGETREPHPSLYFQFSDNRGLREGDLKLVSAKGGRWELYDVSKDRTEGNDLAGDRQEAVEAMAARWFSIGKNIDRLKNGQLRPVGETLVPWQDRERNRHKHEKP